MIRGHSSINGIFPHPLYRLLIWTEIKYDKYYTVEAVGLFFSMQFKISFDVHFWYHYHLLCRTGAVGHINTNFLMNAGFICSLFYTNGKGFFGTKIRIWSIFSSCKAIKQLTLKSIKQTLEFYQKSVWKCVDFLQNTC